MPYYVALAVFQATTLGMFILMMRRLLWEQGTGWLAPLLAFPAVFWTLGLGQNAFLTAALFGGFTLMLDRRPVGAGVLLGALCYKPHFGLLVPGALLAGRRWAAFDAATATVVWLVTASVVMFGWETWHAYFEAFAHSNGVYDSGRIDFAGMVTPFGAARLLGFDPWPAYLVQGAAALVMVVLVGLIWRADVSRNLQSAALLAATLLAVPLVLVYDKMLALVAIGWLLREARQTGFLPWEKLVLLCVYPMALGVWLIGQGLHVPLGPLVSSTVLLLCLRRIWLSVQAGKRPAEATARTAQPAPLGATP